MLSIIIVNYNVKYFLEQCLCSVQRAISSLEAEVLVIDNNSTDDSIEYLQQQFAWVQFIRNNNNIGFGSANNQGWRIAKGEFVLFLNPDTILSEDCLAASLSFMQSHTDAGALGIRMLDGRGKFLPESKRGFPSPVVSFYKLSGLIRLFPHSPAIARYYLGHLPSDRDNEVDVLAGAFMMVRKNVLDRLNGFDEQFFMYAEDVDLSYRIQRLGYKNYYFANCSIVHFKGESTRKDFKYAKLFYGAMHIFVQKYYSGQSWWFAALLKLATWLRATILFLLRMVSFMKTSQPSGVVTSLIIGNKNEANEVETIFERNNQKRSIIQTSPGNEIMTIIKRNKIDEIIYCTGSSSYKNAIALLEILPRYIAFHFHAAGSGSIVGSSSKNNSGQTMAM